MISFFRNIRKQLAAENKVAQYSRYAIGEILLVVVGILIALQVNNWNEKRIIQNEMEKLIAVFEVELSTNIEIAQSFLKYGYGKDSIKNIFSEVEVSEEMAREHPELIRNDFGTRTVDFEEERLNEVIDREKQFQSNYKNLLPSIKELKVLIESQKYWESESLKLAMTRRKELVDNYSWYFRNDEKSIGKRIRHALTDSIYRNKVNHYWDLQLDENVWDASLIRTYSTVILWRINKITNPDESIKEFLASLNLKAMKLYSCEADLSATYGYGFRRSFLTFNNSNDTILCSILNDEGRRFVSYKVAPKAFDLSKIRLRGDLRLEIERNEKCFKQGKLQDADYVLIE